MNGRGGKWQSAGWLVAKTHVGHWWVMCQTPAIGGWCGLSHDSHRWLACLEGHGPMHSPILILDCHFPFLCTNHLSGILGRLPHVQAFRSFLSWKAGGVGSSVLLTNHPDMEVAASASPLLQRVMKQVELGHAATMLNLEAPTPDEIARDSSNGRQIVTSQKGRLFYKRVLATWGIQTALGVPWYFVLLEPDAGVGDLMELVAEMLQTMDELQARATTLGRDAERSVAALRGAMAAQTAARGEGDTWAPCIDARRLLA